MDILTYIKTFQENIYTLLENNLKSNNFSHAYLLSGNFNSPLLDIAIFIAKLILCQNKKFDCETCDSCQKINTNINSLLSLIIIDGNEKTILKDDILQIEERFSKTSIEKNKKFVYIINLAEHMTKEAINSLLKFLEEPNENVYAILTSKNINQVIPTIVSRCQILKIKSEDKTRLISYLNNKEIDEKYLQILINFSISNKDLLSYYQDKNIINLIDKTIEYLENIEDKNKARYLLLTNIIPLTKTDFYARFEIDLLTLFLSESISYHSSSQTYLKSYENILIKIYNNITNINKCLLEIYKIRKYISIHINTTLLFEHIDFLIH